MRSDKKRLITSETQRKLDDHGLDITLRPSITLIDDRTKQYYNPINEDRSYKLISIENTPGLVLNQDRDIGYAVRDYLLSIGINGLQKVVWLPLYKWDDPLGVGAVYSTNTVGCDGDYSVIGFVYTTKVEIMRKYGGAYVKASTKKQEVAALEYLVSLYTAWSNGDIYSISIVDAHGLEYITAHHIYNMNDKVNIKAQELIHHTKRLIRDSTRSIQASIRVDKDELPCCQHDKQGCQHDKQDGLIAYLNAEIYKLFGTKLCIYLDKSLKVKGASKKYDFHVMSVKIDLDRIPSVLRFEEELFKITRENKRYDWRETDEDSEWTSIRTHMFLSSLIDKIPGFTLMSIGAFKKNKKNYLKVPWRPPVAKRNFSIAN